MLANERRRLPAPERRRQIAEVSLEILASSGVKGLTAREIAARVGVRDGSLFRHFDSLESIAGAAIDAFEELMASTFPEDTTDPLRALADLFARRVKLARQRPELLKLALSDRLAEVAGERGAQRVRAFVDHSVGFIREHLERAVKDGRVRDDVPLEVLVWTYTGVLHGTAGVSHVVSSRRRGASLDPSRAWSALERMLTEPAAEGRAPKKKKKR